MHGALLSLEIRDTSSYVHTIRHTINKHHSGLKQLYQTRGSVDLSPSNRALPFQTDQSNGSHSGASDTVSAADCV